MKFKFLPVLLLFAEILLAQDGYFSKPGAWGIGFKSGVAMSKIRDLKTCLAREWNPDSTYSMHTKFEWGYVGGISFYYRLRVGFRLQEPGRFAIMCEQS